MAYILDRDGVFEIRESLQGPGSGNGVFCIEDVKAGTSLPYYGAVFKESEAPEDMDRTFIIAADYNSSKGTPRTSKTYSIDGNPNKEPMSSMPEYKKLGCQVNEASVGNKVNCLFTVNPFLTKDSFKEAFVNQEPVLATIITIIEDVPSGTELLTMYGTSYGKRPYKVCKMKRKEYDSLVDLAYSFTDSLVNNEDDHQTKKTRTEL